MKFRKIDDNKFQCILYQEDMKNLNISLEDIMRSDPVKIHEVLELIMEEAYEELGMDLMGGVMSLQLVPQPNHTLLLTISGRSEENAVSDMIRHIGDELGGAPAQDVRIPAADDVVKQALAIPVVFRFESMDEVESFCMAVKRTRAIQNSLMKGEDGGYYMLVSRNKTCPEQTYISFIANILEYSDIYTSKDLEIEYVKEHSEVLIERNAVNTIKKYCA